MAVESFDPDSYTLHGFHHDIRVPDIGNVLYGHGLVGHDRSGYDSKRSVLCSAYHYLPRKRSAAIYDVMIFIRLQ